MAFFFLKNTVEFFLREQLMFKNLKLTEKQECFVIFIAYVVLAVVTILLSISGFFEGK